MSEVDAATRNSLFALYRDGAYGTLADEVRSLLEAHPRDAMLHTLLGAACLELEDFATAIASYRAALAIRPGFAKAHNSLGIVFLRSGRLQEAGASFQAAIEHDPRFAEARFNLGIVHEHGQCLSDAAGQYEQAVALDAGYSKAWTALANVCQQLGRYDRVAAHYRQALAADGNHLPAHRGLMQFLEQSNRRAELRSALAEAREKLGAGHPLINLHEGVIAASAGEHKTARALLERCRFETADAAGLHDERSRLAHLASVCDTLDDPRRAMDYAAQANGISRQLSAARGVDKTVFLDFVGNRKRYFRRENIRQRPPASKDSPDAGSGGETASPPRATVAANAPRPVFVIGFPRSGTTLIDAMLRGHPQIEVAEECDAVPAMVNRLSGASDAGLATLGNLPRAALEDARAGYYERLYRYIRPAAADTIAIDRFALNIVYAGEICRAFPGARFVLMLRHPADCVLSCYLRTFTETSANASFHTLEEAALLYDRVLGLWTQYTEVLDLDVLEVRYENLVENVESTCRPILEYLELPWHPGVLDHQRTARNRPYIRTASYNQVIEPVHARASGRWLLYREYLEPVLPTLEPWIERLGYRSLRP